MKNLLIVFFMLSLIYLVLYFPFKLRFMGHFDFVELIGFYSIKVMKFKLVNGKISVIDGKILSENSASTIGKNISKEKKLLLIKIILSKVDINKLELFFSGGVADSAFASAMISGAVDSIIKSSYGYLSNNYFDIKLYEDTNTEFGNDDFKITIDLVLSISFLQLLLSVFSVNKKYKEIKNEK